MASESQAIFGTVQNHIGGITEMFSLISEPESKEGIDLRASIINELKQLVQELETRNFEEDEEA